MATLETGPGQHRGELCWPGPVQLGPLPWLGPLPVVGLTFINNEVWCDSAQRFDYML